MSIPVDQRERREPRPETEQDIAAAQRFYTRISHVYDALTDAGERTARDLGLKMLDAQTDEQILEVGFATGTGVVHIARAVGEHGRVLGLDISEGMRNVRGTACGVQRRVCRGGAPDRGNPTNPCDE